MILSRGKVPRSLLPHESGRVSIPLLCALVLAGLALAVWLAIPASTLPGNPLRQPQHGTAERLSSDAGPSSARPEARGPLLYPAPSSPTGEKLHPSVWRTVSTEKPRNTGREAILDRSLTRAIPALREGDPVRLPLFDNSIAQGAVALVQHESGGWYRVAGSLEGPLKGTFTLSTNGTQVAGLIQYPSRNLALEILDDPARGLVLRERLLSDVLCLPMPRPDFEGTTQVTGTTAPAAAPPLLSSRPDAAAVLYLDFDGETVTDPIWNGGRTIVAKAPSLTSTQIQQIWQRVKEDYWPFNVDVTTNVARYTGAAVRHRMRCIITPTDTASPGAGGVAYVDSFAEAGTGNFSNTIPCWVFNTSVTGIAEAISHELGHTLGLSHDGRTSPAEEYYAGQGSGATSWAPIMGVGYNKTVVQWSKGEYANANNKQDDLAIISGSTNGFGYVVDEAGGTIQTAASLSVNGSAINQPGIITKSTDADVYVFTSAAGAATITANPAPLSPNLDLLVELLDNSGTVLVTSNPVDALPASISTNLTGGTYYLRVRGTGKGDPLTTGYSAYASIGEYTITGTIPGGTIMPVITSATTATGEATLDFSYQITATNQPTSYGLTGTLPAGLQFSAATGTISGSPTETGTFNVTISAANSAGSDTQAVAITINPLQAPTITSATSVSGVINTAFSYQITASRPPSSYDLTGALPAGVTFDAASGLISGTPQATGTFPVTVSAANAAGPGSAQVTITISTAPPPTITSAGFASGRVGQVFSYQIVASDNPSAYGYTGTLPAGLMFDASTGLVNGTPTSGGLFSLTVSATNSFGTGTKDLSINIDANALDLTSALDQPDLTWTTSGDGTWTAETDVTHDGVDAASISGLSNRQSATLSTQVEGPASLRFFWRVSSEQEYDYLSFSIDGEERFRISGTVDWKLMSIPVPAGTHQLSFTYHKDAYESGGEDSAWLDQVAFVPREGHSGSDSFSDAQALTGSHVSVLTNNQDATVEPGEHAAANINFGHSLWWSWTAPATGSVAISTSGSAFDTVLSVFTGSSLTDLTKVAFNDDISRSDHGSQVVFRAVAGQTYFISAAGYADNSGNLRFRLDYIAFGDYAGVLTADGGADKLGGLLQLRLTRNLGYTGTVSYGGRRYPFRGNLGAGADAPLVWRGKTLTPLNVTLQTDLANGDNTVIGTLTDGSDTYQFATRRRISATDLPSLAPGVYNCVLEAPTLGTTVAYGSGYGRAIVGTSGSVRFTGAFGDGQRVSQGGILTYGSIWPCFLSPYRNHLGTIAGDLLFDAVADNSFTGTVHWHVENPTTGSFSDDVKFTGSYYFPPSPQFPVLEVSGSSPNARLTFSHRDAAADPTDPKVTFSTATNQFINLPAGFSLTLNGATGLFTGYVPDPVTGVRQPFAGAILESENRGGGVFNSSTGHGKVDIQVLP